MDCQPAVGPLSLTLCTQSDPLHSLSRMLLLLWPPQTQGLRPSTRPAASSNADHANGLDQQQTSASNGSTADARPSGGKAFLAWAKRQSRQRNKSVQQFLLESAQLQEGSSSAAALRPGEETFRAPAGAAAQADNQQAPAQQSDSTMTLQDALALLSSGAQGPQDKQQQQQASPVLAPHNGYVKGAPKPHSHAERVVAADGIQALRRTRDGELGEQQQDAHAEGMARSGVNARGHGEIRG